MENMLQDRVFQKWERWHGTGLLHQSQYHPCMLSFHHHRCSVGDMDHWLHCITLQLFTVVKYKTAKPLLYKAYRTTNRKNDRLLAIAASIMHAARESCTKLAWHPSSSPQISRPPELLFRPRYVHTCRWLCCGVSAIQRTGVKRRQTSRSKAELGGSGNQLPRWPALTRSTQAASCSSAAQTQHDRRLCKHTCLPAGVHRQSGLHLARRSVWSRSVQRREKKLLINGVTRVVNEARK